jgi:hypothetical protein
VTFTCSTVPVIGWVMALDLYGAMLDPEALVKNLARLG